MKNWGRKEKKWEIRREKGEFGENEGRALEISEGVLACPFPLLSDRGQYAKMGVFGLSGLLGFPFLSIRFANCVLPLH